MKQLCNLEVNVQMQENDKFDVYISSEGNSGCHFTDVTADKIGELVAEEVEIRAESYYAISKEAIEERCERCCCCQYIDPVDGFCYKNSKDCWKVEKCEDFETV